MAYTPELSQIGSSTLRRIAWALNEPMTRTIQIIIKEYSESVEPELICKSCRDKTKCSHCLFNNRKSNNQNQQ